MMLLPGNGIPSTLHTSSRHKIVLYKINRDLGQSGLAWTNYNSCKGHVIKKKKINSPIFNGLFIILGIGRVDFKKPLFLYMFAGFF